MSVPLIMLVSVAVLVFLLFIRVPIAFALGLTGALGLIVLDGFGLGMYVLGLQPYTAVRSWLLVAIPLFILMGHFAFAAGVSSRAYEVGNKWLGRLPGGLAMASILACAMFAATSGSSVATAGTMGRVAVPEMKKCGYDMRLATGCTAAGALLGILIPPSIILVLYGALTSTSVSKLLLGAVIPGILTAVVYMAGIGIMVTLKPALAPKAPAVAWREKMRALPKIWEVFLIFLVVMGGIYVGFFTPTEAAGVGALLTLVMALMKGRSVLPEIWGAFQQTSATSAMIFALVMGATLFTYFMAKAGVPNWVSNLVIELEVGRCWILLICLFMYIPLGMFLDTISVLLITMPIIFPIISGLGYDPVWFGILVVKLEEIALITPPVGMNVYVLKGVVPEVPLSQIFVGTLSFLVMEFIVIFILLAFPGIVLWLPNQVAG